METQEYQRLLDRQVKAVKGVCGETRELIVYMDPSDADKVQRICLHHNASIKTKNIPLTAVPGP